MKKKCISIRDKFFFVHDTLISAVKTLEFVSDRISHTEKKRSQVSYYFSKSSCNKSGQVMLKSTDSANI